eukprot:6609287-Pyramimonas_sp.AAC.1
MAHGGTRSRQASPGPCHADLCAKTMRAERSPPFGCPNEPSPAGNSMSHACFSNANLALMSDALRAS